SMASQGPAETEGTLAAVQRTPRLTASVTPTSKETLFRMVQHPPFEQSRQGAQRPRQAAACLINLVTRVKMDYRRAPKSENDIHPSTRFNAVFGQSGQKKDLGVPPL